METVVPDDWHAVLDALTQEKGIAILLGAIDTGKTTFSKFLIDHLCQRKVKVALVDADIGQSYLGPPTTIGLSVFDSTPNWDAPVPSKIFFVGSTTPEENMPLHLEGVKRMADQATALSAEVDPGRYNRTRVGRSGKGVKTKEDRSSLTTFHPCPAEGGGTRTYS